MPKRKNSALNEESSKKPNLKVESNTLTASAVADVSQRDLRQLFPLDVWGEVISHLSSVRDLLSFASITKQSKEIVEKKFNLDDLRDQLRFSREQGIRSLDSPWLEFPQNPYDVKFLSALQNAGFTMEDYSFGLDEKLITSLISMLKNFVDDENVFSPDFQNLISSTVQKNTLDFLIYQNYKQTKHCSILGAAEFLWDCKPYVTSLIEAVSKLKNNKKDPTFIEINQEVEKIYQLQYPILLLFSLDLIFRTVNMSDKNCLDASDTTFLLISALGLLHAVKFNMSYVAFFYNTISKKMAFLKAKQSEDVQNKKLLKNIEDYALGKLKNWCEKNLPLTVRAYAQGANDFNHAVKQAFKIINAKSFKEIALDPISPELDRLLSSPPLFGKKAAKCTYDEIFNNNFFGKLMNYHGSLYADILDEFPNLTLAGGEELSNQPFNNLKVDANKFPSYGSVLCQNGYSDFLKLALKFEAPGYSYFPREKIKAVIIKMMDKHHDKFEHLRSLAGANISFLHACQSFTEFMNFEKMYTVVTGKDKNLFDLYTVLTKTKRYLIERISKKDLNENGTKVAIKILSLLDATKAAYFEVVWKKIGMELPLIQKHLKENSAIDKNFVLLALTNSDWHVFKAQILSIYGPSIYPAYHANHPNNYFQPAPAPANAPQVPVAQTTQNNPTNIPGNRL